VQGRGHFMEGRLVRTSEDTYEVVYPAKKGPAPAQQKKPAQKEGRVYALRRKPLTGPEWYLSADRTQVLDLSGAVVSTAVVVLNAQHCRSGHDKVFVRVQVGTEIWSGYTLKGPENRLRLKPSSYTTLMPPHVTKTRRVCPGCHQRIRGGVEGQLCSRCAAKVRCKNPGCGRFTTTSSVSGLCRSCYNQIYGRQIGAMAGSLPPKRPETTEETEQ